MIDPLLQPVILDRPLRFAGADSIRSATVGLVVTGQPVRLLASADATGALVDGSLLNLAAGGLGDAALRAVLDRLHTPQPVAAAATGPRVRPPALRSDPDGRGGTRRSDPLAAAATAYDPAGGNGVSGGVGVHSAIPSRRLPERERAGGVTSMDVRRARPVQTRRAELATGQLEALAGMAGPRARYERRQRDDGRSAPSPTPVTDAVRHGIQEQAAMHAQPTAADSARASSAHEGEGAARQVAGMGGNDLADLIRLWQIGADQPVDRFARLAVNGSSSTPHTSESPNGPLASSRVFPIEGGQYVAPRSERASAESEPASELDEEAELLDVLERALRSEARRLGVDVDGGRPT
jgi:hypothetical protein